MCLIMIFVTETMRVTNNRGVDVVLEMIGGEVYRKSSALAPADSSFFIGRAFGPVPHHRRFDGRPQKPRAFRSPII